MDAMEQEARDLYEVWGMPEDKLQSLSRSVRGRMDISAELFEALEGINVLHGHAEAYAHLGNLERGGYFARENRIYRRIPHGLNQR
jgi:hypothetical protein